MKGIAHFMGGVAVASFFPAAVQDAGSGDPLLFVLAGVAGLLPDTLDFKFGRYACRHDMEIAPDPLDPDAQLVALALSDAVSAARSRMKRYCIKLHTVRLGRDRWLEYRLRFSRKKRQLHVEFCRIVDSGGNVAGRIEPVRAAAVSLPCDVTIDYGYDIDVGFLEGPTIALHPAGDRVEGTFLHWHRSWSHSLLMTLCVGLPACILVNPMAGVICSLAALQHVLADQAGFMGSNLLFPLEKKRRPGLRVATSGDPVWNLAIVWTAGALILWNLGMAGHTDAGFLHYVFWSIFAPVSAGALVLKR